MGKIKTFDCVEMKNAIQEMPAASSHCPPCPLEYRSMARADSAMATGLKEGCCSGHWICQRGAGVACRSCHWYHNSLLPSVVTTQARMPSDQIPGRDRRPTLEPGRNGRAMWRCKP